MLKCKKTKDRCKDEETKERSIVQKLRLCICRNIQGIFTCVRKERNMKIHCAAVVCVMIAGLVFHISPIEWCICLTLFGLVMALEMVNTAVEAVVDLVTEERKPLAKLAKDAAAGAVLIAAIMAAIAGMIIFIPKLLESLSI